MSSPLAPPASHASAPRVPGGVWTALITPMHPDGTLDWPALEVLVHHQIEAGVTALVACGTTGEAATLRPEEREEVLRRVLAAAGGRVPVWMGTGMQSTAQSLEAQRRAEALGAAGGLMVTPFYNRPSAAGLAAHFTYVAQRCALPLLLYNVPSRTGSDLLPPQVRELAQLPAICGIKEATGALDRVAALQPEGHPEMPADFALLSGDDLSAAAFVLLGGHGVISVASNLAPKQLVACIASAQSGERAAMRAQQAELLPLLRALALAPNPLPIKAACAHRAGRAAGFRLPLVPMEPMQHAELLTVLSSRRWC